MRRLGVLVAAVLALTWVPAGAVPPAPADGAFLHLAPEVEYAAARAWVERAGLAVVVDAPAAHLLYAAGPAASLQAVATSGVVVRVERERPLRRASVTAPWATGVRQAGEPTGGLDLRLRGADGRVVDGSGIGVAVLDGGLDAGHPDLVDKVARNVRYVCPSKAASSGNHVCLTPVVEQEAVDTDSSGHGTHIAGIIAGTGAASAGLWRGVAPGATIYGLGAGDVYLIWQTEVVAALQWVYDRGHLVDPPVKVVNASWSSTGPYDPGDAINKLVDRLVVDRGVTVVFAAGNNGGDGTDDRVNIHGKNPMPGVLAVANYDDDGRGTRAGALNVSSSRGRADDPATWPDLSAPGTGITAPCPPGRWMCALGPTTSASHRYGVLTGTSMAAPHVAGVAALLYQADAGMTPARVEDVLTATAHKFTFDGGGPYEPDPRWPGRTSSFDKGHGLVDAYAALEAVGQRPAAASGGARTRLLVDPADDDLPGALDLRAVDVEEDGDLVHVSWTARDLQDAPPGGAPPDYQLEVVVGQRRHRLAAGAAGVVRSAATVAPLAVERRGDTVVATYAAEDLGAVRGAVLVDAVASTVVNLAVVDVAPDGRGQGAVALAPRAEEHVFAGPVGEADQRAGLTPRSWAAPQRSTRTIRR